MSDSSPQTEPYIREARSSDSPALSHICLLTGNAGQSAEAQHTFGELIGLVYAEPEARAKLADNPRWRR